MEENLEYWLCGAGKMIKIDEKWSIIGTMIIKNSDHDIRNHILEQNQFIHSSVVIRKSVLNEVWLYNPKYNKAEDYELWCRIWLKSKFANLNNIEVKYRINTNWISIKNKLYQKLLAFKICIVYRNNYPNNIYAIFYRIFYDYTPKCIQKIFVKLKKIYKYLKK
jgi:hypothetical protein